MPGHTRLYRRCAVYYHGAAIPKDCAATYPKAEEIVSLKTRDHAEALLRVRIEAVKVDKTFKEHRRWSASQKAPCVDHLSPTPAMWRRWISISGDCRSAAGDPADDPQP